MDNNVMEILIKARDEASQVIKSVGSAAEKTGNTIKDTLKENVVQLGAAFAGVTAAVFDTIHSYEESENVAAQLDAVLKSTHNAAGLTRQDILDQATALQQMSTFSDEAVTSSANLLLTFTQIKGPIMQEAIQTTLDMSQALGQDLKSSAIQLGKALNDPIQGVTALKRVGVSFNEQQLEQIKALQQSGQLMEAQKLILKELSTEFGGSALAASKTFTGQLALLRNNIDDVQETIGKGLIDAISSIGGGFDNINKHIKDLNQFLLTHKDVLTGVVVALLVLVATLGILFLAAVVVTAGMAGVFIAVGGIVVAAVAFIATMIVFHFNEIKAFLMGVWNEITMLFNNGVSIITQWVVSIGNFFSALGTRISAAIGSIIAAVTPAFEVLRGIVAIITGIFLILFAIIFNIISAILFVVIIPIFTAIFQFIWTIVSAIFNLWFGIWSAIFNFEISILSAIFGFVVSIFNQIVGSIAQHMNSAKVAIQGPMTEVSNFFTSKLNEMWSAATSIGAKIGQAFQNLASMMTNALRSIQFPHVSIGTGHASVAGHTIDFPTLNVDWYEQGGFVPRTALAVVHQGEFVLSKAMLAGRQVIPGNIFNNNQPINIGPVFMQGDADFSILGAELAWRLRNSR